jgi:tRNA-modifying protein YgfZ
VSEPSPVPPPRATLGRDHLGDPLREQRVFFSGRSFVDLPAYHVVSLSGPDRLSWLDALCSQSVTNLTSDITTEALILSPQGRVEHRWLMVDDGERAWLLVEPGSAPSLVSWLDRMRFRANVDIDDVTDDYRLVACWGEDGERQLRSVVEPQVIWCDPWPGVEAGGFAYSSSPHAGDGFAVRYAAVKDSDQDALAQLPRSGQWALRAAEIRAGRPNLVDDTDDKTLPHELDWVRTAVHLNKGCYRGQETVAKVHNLGHPPRRLVLLHLDGSESVLPDAGDPVMSDGVQVGQITRAVLHEQWGPIALATVKRTTDESAVLTVLHESSALSASQEVLVTSDAGRVNAPAFSRRSGAPPSL